MAQKYIWKCLFKMKIMNGWAEKINRNVDFVTSVTYEQLTTLISESKLTAGANYLISDYRTKYEQPVTGIIMQGEIEPLIVQAISSNKLSQFAQSDSYPKHIIYYDVDKNVILNSSELSGEWSDGGDLGDDLTISDVTQNSFIVSSVIYPYSDTFNLYVADSSNDYDLYRKDLGTSFTITDLGDGTCRVDLLVDIDLTDPSGYAWVYSLIASGSRNGYITYRKDTERNFSKGYDFLNVKFRRYAVDTVAMAWDSGTTYDIGSHVTYNGRLYISLSTANLNNLPSVATYWNEIFVVADKYLLTGNTVTYGVEKEIVQDTVSYKDFYCFSVLDTDSGDINFDTSTDINNILGDEEVDFLDNNVVVSINTTMLFSNNILSNSYDNTFWHSRVEGNEFKMFTNNIAAAAYLQVSLIKYCKFYKANGNEFMSIIESSFGYNFSNNVVKIVQYLSLATNATKNILKNATYSTGGHYFESNMLSSFSRSTVGNFFSGNVLSSNFLYNTIGEGFVNNIIASSQFDYNCIGNYFTGNTISATCSFRYNHFERCRFEGNTISPSTSKIISNIDCIVTISDKDFSSATLIYLTQPKKITANASGTLLIEYLDALNVYTYGAVTD